MGYGLWRESVWLRCPVLVPLCPVALVASSERPSPRVNRLCCNGLQDLQVIPHQVTHRP